MNTALCWSFTDIVLLYFHNNQETPRRPKIWTQMLYPQESVNPSEPVSPWVRKEGLAGERNCWYPGFCLRLLRASILHGISLTVPAAVDEDVAYTVRLVCDLDILSTLLMTKCERIICCSVKLLEFACLSISTVLAIPLHFLTCKQAGRRAGDW